MYTYFAATLPMLQFDGALPLTAERFAADCGRLLPESAAREVRLALGHAAGEPSSGFLRRWHEYERALRAEAAGVRAQRLHRPPPREPDGARAFDGRINDAVAQAAGMDDPLEAERSLLEFQWQLLDELALNREFTLDAILAYALKLAVLERLSAFKSEDGLKELKALLETAVHSQHGI